MRILLVGGMPLNVVLITKMAFSLLSLLLTWLYSTETETLKMTRMLFSTLYIIIVLLLDKSFLTTKPILLTC